MVPKAQLVFPAYQENEERTVTPELLDHPDLLERPDQEALLDREVNKDSLDCPDHLEPLENWANPEIKDPLDLLDLWEHPDHR